MTKKIVVDAVDVDVYQLGYYGAKIGDVLTYVSELVDKYGPDKELEISSFDEYGSISTVAVVKITREETDKEYNTRLDLDRVRKANRKAHYEELKKEFEGK